MLRRNNVAGLLEMRSPNRRHDVQFLYKYATAATGIAVLTTQTLRWSSPLIFNDPFDVPREWEGFTFAELEEAMIHRFASYLRGEAKPGSVAAQNLLQVMQLQSGTTPQEVLLSQMRFFFRLLRKPMEGYMEDFRVAWQEKVPGIRILCFSEDPASTTMWAHYAESHTGVVLQFESSDERDSSWLLAQPVIYQTKKPSLPNALEWARAFMDEIQLDWDEFLREYHFVKYTDWRYEREYRVVSAKKQEETGLYADYLFHPEDLRGVVLGAKIDPQNEESIRGVIAMNYPNAIIYRAQIDYANRSVVQVAT